jgi:hypothetical protein
MACGTWRTYCSRVWFDPDQSSPRVVRTDNRVQNMPMYRKPAPWILLGLLSLAGAVFSFAYFPSAFPLISLDLRMDRQMALERAREQAQRFGWGPDDFQAAASFRVDRRLQNFVELEAGGKEAFGDLLRGDLHSPYSWLVRHFREGEANETLIRFTPAGEPYGFEERIPEDQTGAALTPDEAAAVARRAAEAGWGIDLAAYEAVEQSQEVRPSGRVDHTLVFERPEPRLGEGRYRLRLSISGDRLTELTHFVRIPEGFGRRFEEMRAANDAIATGASVAMVVLYIFVGCLVGLFFLVRQHWVIWRRAVFWGFLVAFLQALVGLNDWPLAWMAYDTAITSQTFVAQRLLALCGEMVFMGGLLSISFMAAESLSRRAFPHHIQFWRIWSRPAASSLPVLGQTVAGYLLVSLFFSYAVVFYFLSSRFLGWWTPSEALFHPDVLATYFPWYSSIAISLQAGFWEECLFRAVPLAGAALLGKRFGRPRLWIGGAFLVQALIFAAAHANYPNLPAYTRVVELMLPSFLFGALFLAFGLLPAIILHFGYDVVWFALPLFASTAPGARLDQLLVVALALIPLWVVLLARLRSGAWRERPPEELYNAAWSPPPPAAAAVQEPGHPVERPDLGRGRTRIVQVGGLLGLALWLGAGHFHSEAPPVEIDRSEALAIARQTLTERGAPVEEPWRLLASMETPLDMSHRFVWREGGPDLYRDLLGEYLAPPHLRVRMARFEGDVAERAEEYLVLVDPAGRVGRVRHRWPEDRPGARLTEEEARIIAHDALRAHFRKDPELLRPVSVTPSNLPGRDDWVFTFSDPEAFPPAQGEARLSVVISGDRVVDTPRFIHVPEEWERAERNRVQRNGIFSLASALVVAALLGAGVIGAIVGWTRKVFSWRVFLLFFGLLVGANALARANDWPSVVAGFSTAQPWNTQLLTVLAGLVVSLLFLAFVLALVNGFAGRWSGLAAAPGNPMTVGVPLGLLAAGVFTAAGRFEIPLAPLWADYGSAGSQLPWLGVALSGWISYVAETTFLVLLIVALDRFSRCWTRRRAFFVALLPVLGIAVAGAGSVESFPSWLISGVLTGALLLGAYIWIIRYNLALLPFAVAGFVLLDRLGQAWLQAFPGALAGNIVAILLVFLFAAYWARILTDGPAGVGVKTASGASP